MGNCVVNWVKITPSIGLIKIILISLKQTYKSFVYSFYMFFLTDECESHLFKIYINLFSLKF